MGREVLEKVTCDLCDRFLGLITDDGKGPVFAKCPVGHWKKPCKDRPACPMYAKLEAYQQDEELKMLIEVATFDVARCEAGNKSAGVRVRKVMQEVKRKAQAVRLASVASVRKAE